MPAVDYVCVVTVNNAGDLSVKQVASNHSYLIESLVFSHIGDSDDDSQ